MSGCNGKHAIKCRTRLLEWFTSHFYSHFFMPLGQQRANFWQAIDLFIGSSRECMGLISTNPRHDVNHKLWFPRCIVPSVHAKRLLVKKKTLLIHWSPEYQRALPDYYCFDGQWWKHRWMWERPPPPLPQHTLLLRFPISTGMEAYSLATGHSGSVLTELCLFPGLQGSQGKPGSRGGDKQKGTTVSNAEAALQHIRLFYSMGDNSLLRRAMAKGNTFSFFKTGPQDSKSAVVLSYVFFFSV